VDDQWLTTAELADRLRTVPSTVRYWKHRGYGPSGTRFGRRTLYKLADVIAWEKRQQEAQHHAGRSAAHHTGAGPHQRRRRSFRVAHED